jgi:hypothetical protein
MPRTAKPGGDSGNDGFEVFKHRAKPFRFLGVFGRFPPYSDGVFGQFRPLPILRTRRTP